MSLAHTITGRTATSVLALSALMVGLSLPASADSVKSVSIDKITTQFDAAPVLKFKDSGNGYVFDEAVGTTIRVRLRAEASFGGKLFPVIGTVQNRIFYMLPQNYVPHAIDQVEQTLVTAQDLKPFHATGISHCNLAGQPRKVVKGMFQLPVRLEATSQLSNDKKSDLVTYAGTIVCGPRKAPKGPGDVAAKEPTYKVTGIHVRFLTSLTEKTQPNPGTKCEVTHARVRVATSKAGPVKFKLWTKVGNGPSQSQFVEAWSSFKGPGKFEAVFNKKITISKSSTVQAMAEDKTNAIGQSTGWKSVKLDCTGAGGGGLAGTPQGGASPGKLPKGSKELVTRPKDPPTGPTTSGKAPAPKKVGKQQVRRPTHLTAPRRTTAAKEVFVRSKPHVN